MCGIQANAWFDENVMNDWIERVWRKNNKERKLLILDNFKVHKKAKEKLKVNNSIPVFVAAEATRYCQPLDVGPNA